MVKVVWTDLALEDLKSIHEYISKDSKFYADRFVTHGIVSKKIAPLGAQC
jgi:plasmid stabilization system protein ParE